jgi:tetratricopeptide (TPR) repeat protein
MKSHVVNFFKAITLKGRLSPYQQPAYASRLLALGLALGFFVSPAGADTSWFERREMSYARRAFQDTLYDVSRLKLERFLEKRPDSDFSAEAKWLLGQSYYFLGQYDKALDQFKTIPSKAEKKLKGGYLYWQGETLNALGRHPEAAVLYQQYLNEYADGENRTDAHIGLSVCLENTGQAEEAREALNPLLDAEADSLPHQRGLLQLAKLDMQDQSYAEALSKLETLKKNQLQRSLIYEVDYWIGLNLLRMQRYQEARQVFAELTEDPQAHPRTLVVRSWMGLGQALREEESWPEASRAYQQAYRLSLDGTLIEEAVLEYLHCQYRQGTLAKGAIEVRKFASRNPEVALPGLIAIGQYYFNDGNHDACISEMDNFVQDYPDSEMIWTARLLIARAFDAKGDAEAAVKSYRSVIEQDISPTLSVNARKDLARFYFERQQYEPAAEAFIALAEAGNCPPALRETARFSALKALAAENRVEAFSEQESEFHKAFPESAYGADLLMIKARLFRRAGESEKARELFSQLAEAHPGSRQAADALFSLGSSYYEAGLYDQASNALKMIEQEHPTYSEITETIYLRIISDLNTGQLDHEEARQQLTSLGDSFVNSPLLPKIRFKAAFTWIEQGRYLEALTAMTGLMKDCPNTPEAEYAAYLAGRSAMRLKKFKEAIAHFEEIPQASEWKVHSHLAQIRCYMAQGEFKSAREIAESIISKSEPGPVRSEALIRKADCLITEGEDSGDIYLDAFKAVEQVIQSPESSVAQRNEAGFLKGKILQKQGKESEALEAYLDVVYGKLLPANVAQQSVQPETHFFIESGVTAAQILKDTGDIRGAVEVYRILERLSAPHRNQFRRAIEDLKTQHFIYEET